MQVVCCAEFDFVNSFTNVFGTSCRLRGVVRHDRSLSVSPNAWGLGLGFEIGFEFLLIDCIVN